VSKFQVGDRVRVRKPANIYQYPNWTDSMDCFDGTEQEISKVNVGALHHTVHFAKDSCNYYFHFDWLEPVAPKTLNVGDPVEPMRSWVPDGYSVVEMAVPDEMAAAIGEGNALMWKQANFGERYLSSNYSERYLSSNYNRVKIRQTRTNEFHSVIVPTTPPAEQYREPTAADVGRVVEVRDSEDADHDWQARELLAVIGDKKVDQRFVCRDRNSEKKSLNWRFARIKIEGSK
jgi:hypothetical protein